MQALALTKSISLTCNSIPVLLHVPAVAPSRISEASPMTKTHREIDTRNPFIPATSPVCRAADTALLYCVTLIGLAAAAIALARQVL